MPPLDAMMGAISGDAVHGWTKETERLAKAVFEYARERLLLDPAPLDGPRSAEELLAAAGETVTARGLGGDEALRVFAEVLAPACVSIDNPRYLSFIPCAPTSAATLFDLVVGASCIYGGSWLEGAGAVFAENQALRWIADLAGLPSSAGGVFVQGGTHANLSALVVARHAARLGRARAASRPRWAVAASADAHSSVQAAASVMDVEVLAVATDTSGRMSGETLLCALEAARELSVFAVVASAGTTNLGLVDRLSSVADVAQAQRLWFHVDGAYGGAALAAPSVRGRFAGIERADSLVVDPHKWLFAPFDCAALIYRDPSIARGAHGQHAAYLEPLEREPGWNPSDYAIHLTRRARGLPLWFSLATHGTDAYSRAVERTLEVARHAARSVRRRPYLELVAEPELSVVAFRRLGWEPPQYYAWSARLRSSGHAFVVPSGHHGETVARIAIVNPRTSEEDIDYVLESLH